ncbi:MAG: hypothetical protein QNJ29_13275 [Rhizobiaceae bacterium]|nr:hypothetical protein [Rhizobiaceae bacterium]
MTACVSARKFFISGIASLFGAVFFVTGSSMVPVAPSDAKAQSYSSGVVLKMGGVSKKRVTGRTKFPVTNTVRSARYYKYGNRKIHKRKFHHKRYKYTDRLIERRKLIEQRNRRVAFENAARRNRNAFNGAAAGVLVLDVPTGNMIVSSQFDGGTSPSVVSQSTQAIPCPKGYNCGYRVYSDGTGPRIITLGAGPQNGLPEYDGLSGPLIITVK